MMMIWLRGLLTQRLGRLLGTAAGVALAVALLAVLGAFLVSSSASMTIQAVATVPVDWQIQLAAGTDPRSVIPALAKATAYDRLQPVGYADTAGFVAHSSGTVQTTGPGKVLGIDPSYRANFPGQIRSLIGSLDGALVAQQTAANLHVTVGDTVTVERIGFPSVDVRVDGIVDLPNADSMFQAVGLPPGMAPQAPPDNVVLLPLAQWHGIFDPQANIRPGSVHEQLHVGLPHDRLPRDPESAYVAASGAARNLEARIAGTGMVANNLAARLDSVRSDALYAKVLFLFLGTPGVLLAVLLTISVAAAGAPRRRRVQSLLRTRGASIAQILRLAGLEAAVIGVAGLAIGLALAYLFSLLFLRTALFAPSSLAWVAGAALLGLAATAVAVLLPAWIDARQLTVVRAVAPIGHRGLPVWQRLYLDLLLLLLSAVSFWQTASGGYQIVLAPEGVAASSVDYYAFISPMLLWIGLGLLSARLLRIAFGPGRGALRWALRPVAGVLAGSVAASLGRQRDRLTRGVVLVLVATSFAVSTATFDATYNAQSRVDAELTNGAGVTVTGTPATPAEGLLRTLATLPGVVAAQPMQHRFAYVGTDLQDLYGIDPALISEATRMSDAYFQDGAKATLAGLAQTPDGVLVSEETVKDFQLQRGDEINLRLLSAKDHQYHKIPFHFVGVVREFPTAPRDSFLVANAAYIGEQTGAPAAEIVLLRTSGDPAKVADAARAAAGPVPGIRITDVGNTLRLISSSLTAIDVGGLTKIELGFAVLMVIGAAGIVFALNLTERRRAFAILSAIGAKREQIGAFIWSEGLLVFLGGSIIGLLTGLGIAEMLIKLLTGVFDPPPESLTIPWLYILFLMVAMFASTIAAIMATEVVMRRPVIGALKEI
ncbi:MAG: putative transport system permease protein [Rhodospirillaceae bacterium]|nr:putative transport system permease protein [Rhodospirillaceae bacterium]